MRLRKMAMIAALGLALPGNAYPPGVYPPGLDPARVDRARHNYEALRDGRKQIGNLSTAELEDVAALDRYLRDQELDRRTISQRCVDDELRRLDAPPSLLTQRVIDMKCREAGESLR